MLSRCRWTTADDPVVLLKLCYLQIQYGLSDRAMIVQAQVTIALCSFLALVLTDDLPTHLADGLSGASRNHLG
ncbi:MAG: transposase [Oscillochloris sp.]|nr:transposase [Oscillochloris sp.]